MKGELVNIALEDSGALRLVTNCAQVGDFICGFDSSDILVVLQQHPTHEEQYQVLGRCSTFSSPHASILHLASESHGIKVQINFNIRTLQLLTTAIPQPTNQDLTETLAWLSTEDRLSATTIADSYDHGPTTGEAIRTEAFKKS